MVDKHFNTSHQNPSCAPLSIVLELGGLKRSGVPELRILYALIGTAKLIQNGLHHLELAVGSIHIINPGDYFEISSMDNFVAVVFSIAMEPFYAQMPSLSGTCFSIHAMGVNQDDYDALSQLLLLALKIFSGDSEENTIFQSLNTHSIMLLLIRKFQQQPLNSINIYKTNDSTIQRLMTYIDQNCHKKLTLPSLSEVVYLNPQYLSRLFKRETGITLIRYINHARILKSEQDILHSKLSAADIAEKHGFANTKSFYKAFREVFGKTPGEHKADLQRESDSQQNFHLRCPSPMFYTKEMVKQFIQSKGDDGSLDILLPDPVDWPSLSTMEHRIQLSVSSEEGRLHNHWSYSLYPGFPKNNGGAGGIEEDVSHCFGKINCHMVIYCEDREGNPYYDFSHLDNLTDQYLSQGFPLIVEIFQSSAPLPCHFHRHSNMGMAQDRNKWLSFVTTLVGHMYDRLGQERMRNIFFSLWTDPTLYDHWPGTKPEFFDFIASTCRAIKSIDSHLKVGVQNLNPENITVECLHLLKATLEEQETSLYFIGCMISFLCPDPATPLSRRLPPETGRGYVLTQSHYPLQLLHEFRQKMIQCGLSHLKLFITSATPTRLWGDQTQNTIFLNAFIAKTLLDFLPVVDHIHFDTGFTTVPLPLQAPHGHGGFQTSHALNVSRMNIFRLLARLGTRILRKSAHCIVTAHDGDCRFQVLCYNYCHYRSDLKTPDQLTNLPVSSLYSAFSRGETRRITVTLQELHGTFLIKKYRLNTRNGSAFDAWLQIGAPENPSIEDFHHIQGRSLPDYSVTTIHADGHCAFDCLVAPHEVEYIEIIHKESPENR